MSLSIALQQIQMPTWWNTENGRDRRIRLQKEASEKHWATIKNKLLNAIKKHGQLSQAQMEKELGCASHTIYVAMRQLKEEKKVVAVATVKKNGGKTLYWGVKGGAE